MVCGLYGQPLTWTLETLFNLDKANIYPKWELSSSHYGNIFGKYILENYDTYGYSNTMDIKELNNRYAHHYGDDFTLANKMWYKYFKFSEDITNVVDDYTNRIDLSKTLSIHYRGTDKINTEGDILM